MYSMSRKYFPFALAFFMPLAARAEEALGHAKPWQLGFQEPASPVMEQLTWLHDKFLLYIITVITAFVLLLTLYICLRYNRRANPTPSKNTHNTTLEIVWTVIPIIVLVAIAIPSLRTHYFMEREVEAEMTLKVTGRQWYWSYEYPDHGNIAFDSYMIKEADLKPGQLRLLEVDNRVVVPVDTLVRVQLTGADVIHAWSIPALGVKKDAVPGRLNQTWFKANKTGLFYGQCSELCGVNHGFMPIALQVVSKDAFAAWVKEKQGPAAPAAEPTPAAAPTGAPAAAPANASAPAAKPEAKPAAPVEAPKPEAKPEAPPVKKKPAPKPVEEEDEDMAEESSDNESE
jgi:cytochrome c oxidase subunit 2